MGRVGDTMLSPQVQAGMTETGVPIINMKGLQKWTTANVTAEASSRTQRTVYAVTRVGRTSMGNTHTDTDFAIGHNKIDREDDNLLSGGISRSDRPSLVRFPPSGVEITGKESDKGGERLSNTCNSCGGRIRRFFCSIAGRFLRTCTRCD